MTRARLIADFLTTHGYAKAEQLPLPQDASARHYIRLRGGPQDAILMDAPPPHEDVRPFLHIGAHLAEAGLSVPRIYAADEDTGLVLLEDLGNATYPAALADGAGEAELYGAAVDALAAMQKAAPPAGLPAWDAEIMTRLAGATFLDWWWPAMFGAAPGDAVREDFNVAMQSLLAPLTSGPHELVHRDYFASNLMWLPERSGLHRAGIIDFQDAMIGHPAYDLVSLIEDARRDLSPALRAALTDRYLALRPDLDAAAFRNAMVICAAHRHLRVAALWVRLDRRDRKPHYLRLHSARTWGLLRNALAHPTAAPLAAFMDRHVPPAQRTNPVEHAA